MLILNAAAQYIHHVTPDKRVELLEEVIGIVCFFKWRSHWGLCFRGLEDVEGEECSINNTTL